MKKIGFIGMGNMGQALAGGIAASGKVEGKNIYAYAPNQEKLARNCEKLGINSCSSLDEVAEQSDVIVIACKPYQIEGVIAELGDKLSKKSILSVAASWDFKKYSLCGSMGQVR
mgnify:FL=1